MTLVPRLVGHDRLMNAKVAGDAIYVFRKVITNVHQIEARDLTKEVILDLFVKLRDLTRLRDENLMHFRILTTCAPGTIYNHNEYGFGPSMNRRWSWQNYDGKTQNEYVGGKIKSADLLKLQRNMKDTSLWLHRDIMLENFLRNSCFIRKEKHAMLLALVGRRMSFFHTFLTEKEEDTIHPTVFVTNVAVFRNYYCLSVTTVHSGIYDNHSHSWEDTILGLMYENMVDNFLRTMDFIGDRFKEMTGEGIFKDKRLFLEAAEKMRSFYTSN